MKIYIKIKLSNKIYMKISPYELVPICDEFKDLFSVSLYKNKGSYI